MKPNMVIHVGDHFGEANEYALAFCSWYQNQV